MTALRTAPLSRPIVTPSRARSVVGLGLTLAALEVAAALSGVLWGGAGGTRTLETAASRTPGAAPSTSATSAVDTFSPFQR